MDRLHRYLIFLKADIEVGAPLSQILGHEMYHRVTCKVGGMRREEWIDEMMAWQVSHRLLREHGYAHYAEIHELSARMAFKIHHMETLRHMRRKYYPFGRKASLYPDGMEASVISLGTALRRLLDWDVLCRLIACSSLEQWLDGMSARPRRLVRYVLRLPYLEESDLLDWTPEDYRDLGHALYLKGDFSRAATALQEAIGLDGGRVQDYVGMGIISWEQGDIEEAIKAYEKALEYKFQNSGAHHGLAAIYLRQGRLEDSVREYRTLVQLDPDYAYGHYCLGLALKQAGMLSDARESWRKVLEFEDKVLTVQALAQLSETEVREAVG